MASHTKQVKERTDKLQNIIPTRSTKWSHFLMPSMMSVSIYLGFAQIPQHVRLIMVCKLLSEWLTRAYCRYVQSLYLPRVNTLSSCIQTRQLFWPANCVGQASESSTLADWNELSVIIAIIKPFAVMFPPGGSFDHIPRRCGNAAVDHAVRFFLEMASFILCCIRDLTLNIICTIWKLQTNKESASCP